MVYPRKPGSWSHQLRSHQHDPIDCGIAQWKIRGRLVFLMWWLWGILNWPHKCQYHVGFEQPQWRIFVTKQWRHRSGCVEESWVSTTKNTGHDLTSMWVVWREVDLQWDSMWKYEQWCGFLENGGRAPPFLRKLILKLALKAVPRFWWKPSCWRQKSVCELHQIWIIF